VFVALRCAIAVVLCALAGLVSSPRPARADDTTGTLVVPSVLSAKAAAEAGLAPVRVWVHASGGAMLRSGATDGGYALDEPIILSEGQYLVEVGTERADANRLRVAVRAGKATVVPTGLVRIDVEPSTSQPPDVCATWSASLEASLRPPVGDGPVVARAGSPEATRSALQLVPGYYRLHWNGASIELEVTPWTVYHVETGLTGPFQNTSYEVALAEGADKRVALCQRRPTRLLARTYAATFMEPISEPPFRERVWGRLVVATDSRRKSAFEPLKRPRTRPGELAAAEALLEATWAEAPAPAPTPTPEVPPSPAPEASPAPPATEAPP
jgi:hypothetical protein